jgi:hypothetical protein
MTRINIYNFNIIITRHPSINKCKMYQAIDLYLWI